MPVQEDDLVRDAANGDESALVKLLAIRRESLVRMVEGRISSTWKSIIAAEDVVQSGFVEIFKRMNGFTFRSTPAFNSWVIAITLRQLYAMIRTLRAQKRGGPAITPPADSTVENLMDLLKGPTATPSREIAADEASEMLQGAVELLPEQQKQAVCLVYFEGLSARETAGRLGTTERGVHGLCRRGLAKLRSLLRESQVLVRH